MGHAPGGGGIGGGSSGFYADVIMGGFSFLHVPVARANCKVGIGQSHVPAERQDALIVSKLLVHNSKTNRHTAQRPLYPLAQQHIDAVQWALLPEGRADGAAPSGAEVIGPIITAASSSVPSITTYIYHDPLKSLFIPDAPKFFLETHLAARAYGALLRPDLRASCRGVRYGPHTGTRNCRRICHKIR